MSLWLTISQTTIEAGITITYKLYNNPHIQVLLVLFSKEKNKKTLFQANLSFYLCTKGQECELHHFERDDAVGDADDGDTASDTCEEVIERKLPADENCPDHIRDYVL